jgi:hypothetical protein
MLCSFSSCRDALVLRARPIAIGLGLAAAVAGCQFRPAGGQAPGPDPSIDASSDPPGAPDAGSAPGSDAMSGDTDAGAPSPFVLRARPVRPNEITIDGDLGDWTDEDWIALTPDLSYRTDFDVSAADANDLAVRFAARWHDTDGLFLAFEVTDEHHVNTTPDTINLWRWDSIQIGVDVSRSGGNAYDNLDDFEYGWALTDGGLREHRWAQGLNAALEATQFQVRRDGTTTTYEIRLSPGHLGLITLSGRTMGFSMIVNEDDADADASIDQVRDGWIEWTPGIARGKTPGSFGVLELLAP